MVQRIAHEITRTGAALVDLSARGKVVVSGADRRSYLHAMFTNDIAALAAGRGCYSAFLTPQGRMIADMMIADLGDVVLVELDASVKGIVVEKLDQFIFSEDVQLGDVSEAFAEFGLYGARSASILTQAIGAPAAEGEALSRLDEYANLRVGFQDDIVIVVASRDLAPQGFVLLVERTRGAALEQALVRAGAVVIGDDEAEVLRVERGRPRFGRDMDEDTIPLEAGIESRAISHTKGCYPGQAVITRIRHRGHGRVARKLVGLIVEGDTEPSAGDSIRSGEHVIGRVTSAAVSPTVGRPIALAYIHRDFVTPGTAVEINQRSGPIAARVSELPFVKD